MFCLNWTHGVPIYDNGNVVGLASGLCLRRRWSNERRPPTPLPLQADTGKIVLSSVGGDDETP